MSRPYQEYGHHFPAALVLKGVWDAVVPEGGL